MSWGALETQRDRVRRKMEEFARCDADEEFKEHHFMRLTPKPYDIILYDRSGLSKVFPEFQGITQETSQVSK